MFNLDDTENLSNFDRQDMLNHIDGLPDQLEESWKLGIDFQLPQFSGIQNILISGMGGSAIGGDLLAAYVEPFCRVPVITQRDYSLPAWAEGPQTLVIASSHSGDTEEVLYTFREAQAKGSACLAITTGGELERLAVAGGSPVLKFCHAGQPRSAVGYSFGLLLSVFARLDLIPDPEDELFSAASAMRLQQKSIQMDVQSAQNIAKRYAGQMMGRFVAIFGSGILSPVARRWKTQINELAKAWAQYEILPEADHNTLTGVMQPQKMTPSILTLFLCCPGDHPRNRLRSDLTRQTFMVEGLNTDVIYAQGTNSLSYQWTSLHLGDYISYYLAMGYGIDPTPVEAIKNLKREMLSAG